METWGRQVCLLLCDVAGGEARGGSRAEPREEIVYLRKILGGPAQQFPSQAFAYAFVTRNQINHSIKRLAVEERPLIWA